MLSDHDLPLFAPRPEPDRQAARDRVARHRAVAARDWAADWDDEIDAFPEDEATILATTRTLIAASARPIGMAKVWELLRGKVKCDLSNNYRAPCARRLMARHPDLVGKIATRADAGQIRERGR